NRCPECGTRPFQRQLYFHRLRTEWPADRIDKRHADPEEERVVVLETPESIEAHLIVEHLEARGIPAAVQVSTAPIEYGHFAGRTTYYVVAYKVDVDFVGAFFKHMRGEDESDDQPQSAPAESEK